jgi:parallel beta-helix repeat protein
LILSTAASAAIKCVNPHNNACFTTIGTAASAASEGDTIQVASGTYHEIVVIDKSYLSLIGTNKKNTIIDASGLSVVINTNNIASGIYVDGMDNPGLCHAVIRGFTVKGANFEGILVANAMSVTVADNFITDNDKSRLPPSTCPGIASFETNEGFDCGGGIHLMGANYSFVSSNIVENNAGGILISDETAGSYSNVIDGNTIENNPFDGGITLASNPPAAVTGRLTPFGVTNNTIAGNISSANGLQGEGAGVGIFDSAIGAKNSGNVVINNTLTNNGLPGVAIHSEMSGHILYGNQIVSNTISGNGADISNGTTVRSGPGYLNSFPRFISGFRVG